MLYSEKSWVIIRHLLRSEEKVKGKRGGKKKSPVLKSDFTESVTDLDKRELDAFFLISCDEHHKTVCERIKIHCSVLDFLPLWSMAGGSNF